MARPRSDRHLVVTDGGRLPPDVRDGGALRGVRHPPARDPGVALRAHRRGGAPPPDPGRQRAPRHAPGRHRGAGRSRHHPRPGVERTRPLRRARARGRAARRPRARACASSRCAPAPSRSRPPASSTDAAPPPTGCTPRSSRRATRGSASTPQCSTWTRGRSSPRPAPPPASTCASTWSARTSGPRRPTPSLAAWSSRRTATGARRSSCRPRCRRAPRTTSSGPLLDLDGRAPRRGRSPWTTSRRRAQVSPRTFARRFVEVTGTTPIQWLLTQRVLRARALLETTDLPVERIAHECGFSTGAGPPRPLPAGGRRLAGHLPAHVPRRSRLVGGRPVRALAVSLRTTTFLPLVRWADPSDDGRDLPSTPPPGGAERCSPPTATTHETEVLLTERRITGDPRRGRHRRGVVRVLVRDRGLVLRSPHHRPQLRPPRPGPSLGPRTWPSSARVGPSGPRACSFWVLMPISAPNPNSSPSTNRVEALTSTAAASTSAVNRSAAARSRVTIASLWPEP